MDDLSQYKPSGLLNKKSTTASNSTASQLKYHECEDACQPTDNADCLQMFVLKGTETVESHVLDRSFYRLGRDARLNQLSLLHESVSSQHAVLQYRLRNGRCRLYVMDLDSANGTRLNGAAVEGRRFYELLDGDVVQFAASTREYVFLRPKQHSATG